MPPFHPGELAVQERAGVRERASRVGSSIAAEIPPVARAFLEERPWIVLGAADRQGRPWASLVAGPAGFARVTGPREVCLARIPGEPLDASLGPGTVVGLLAIDPSSRRRMRVNGTLAAAEGAVVLHADQVYSNCPKYIHPRTDSLRDHPPGVALTAAGLADPQREWIRRADTFFIATVNPGEGADASHRGGPPGFVDVEGDRLRWPDYAGNMMYNTLGNIERYPRAGLLFVDFERGARLMLTGRARIDWDAASAARVPGAQRVVELDVEEVIEVATP